MNSSFMKFVVLLFVILYCVSPVDALIGPVDDIIVILMGAAMNRRIQ